MVGWVDIWDLKKQLPQIQTEVRFEELADIVKCQNKSVNSGYSFHFEDARTDEQMTKWTNLHLEAKGAYLKNRKLSRKLITIVLLLVLK